MLVSFQTASKYPERFLGLLDNLQSLADDPTCFEVLVKIDSEDPEYAALLEREKARRPFGLKALATPRAGGYPDLWIGLNQLYQMTDPRCYFAVAINDELRIQEKGWDTRLARYRGLFPDHIFRLRSSALKLRQYFDLWECGYAPENYAFTTTRWLDITEGWNPCFGPDSSQQFIAYYLAKANLPSHQQYVREVPILDINWGNEGAGVDLSGEAARLRNWQNMRTWQRIVSHPMQEELHRRARLLQAHIIIEDPKSDVFVGDAEIYTDRRFKAVVIASRDDGAVLRVLSYRVPRLRHFLATLRRNLQYYYYGGGGAEAFYAQPFAAFQALRGYFLGLQERTERFAESVWYWRVRHVVTNLVWRLYQREGGLRRAQRRRTRIAPAWQPRRRRG
jgi:hypothetical protein